MIIITGASRGIGRALCDRFINSGNEVFGLARETGGLSFPCANCDVSSADEVANIARKIKASGKRVTGLINAAGIASMNLALTTPSETVQRIITTNLIGTIYCCQSFAPLMVRNKSGRIVNFSTIAVALGLKGEAVYCGSKGGVESFTNSFAREVSCFNITVNCVAPGPIATDLIKGVSSQQISAIIANQVITKQFSVTDVCDVVEILFSEKLKSISGQILNIGGV